VVNEVRASDSRYGCYGGYQRLRTCQAAPGGNGKRRSVRVGIGARQPVAGLIAGNGGDSAVSNAK
jgi:hypothetical protein